MAPEEPAPFLELLLRSTRDEADRLGDAATAIDDDDLRADVNEVRDRLSDHIGYVLDLLDQPNTGVFGGSPRR